MPAIVLVFSIYLVIAPIIDNPKMEYVYSIMFMASGALLYVPFVYYKLKLPYTGIFPQAFTCNLSGLFDIILLTGKLSQTLQLILRLVPPTSMPDC